MLHYPLTRGGSKTYHQVLYNSSCLALMIKTAARKKHISGRLPDKHTRPNPRLFYTTILPSGLPPSLPIQEKPGHPQDTLSLVALLTLKLHPFCPILRRKGMLTLDLPLWQTASQKSPKINRSKQCLRIHEDGFLRKLRGSPPSPGPGPSSTYDLPQIRQNGR